ncbi:MAG: hypothetical protein VX764_10830 [Planctomycetota bacterium]|nr:hypothetical protein [Planctomycetota bacterium]
MARKSLLLRIDDRIHQQLRRWADDELRSVNAQIEYLLRQAVMRRHGNDPLSTDPPPAEDPQD